MKHRCPVCKRIVKVSREKQAEKAPYFPFCSQRCKLIDLGAWLDAEYRINSDLGSEESGDVSDASADDTADEKQ